MSNVVDELRVLARLPERDAGEWLSSAESGVEFLKDHLRADTTVLYASLNAVMVHGVLVPLEPLASMDHDKLRHEFVMPDDAWAIEHVSGGGEPDRVYLTPPLRRLGPSLDQGEKLVFKRSFAGVTARPRSRLAKNSFTRSICISLRNAMRGAGWTMMEI